MPRTSSSSSKKDKNDVKHLRFKATDRNDFGLLTKSIYLAVAQNAEKINLCNWYTI